MAHSHHHHHGNGKCDCQLISEGDSLYSYIDKDRIRCLNELYENSAKFIFKPMDASRDRSQVKFRDSLEARSVFA